MIRPLEREDLEWVRLERNRPECRMWFRQDHLISKEEQEKWFATTDMKSFMVGDREGVVALSHLDLIARKCEFSIMITPENRCKGLGTIALRELLDHAFNDLNMNMVYSDVFEDNPALKLYDQLGFRRYGKLPNWYWKDGKYINSVVIAITKDEYNSLK
jgi:diamine N-acetyltransferase